MIPRLDARAVFAHEAGTLQQIAQAATDVGFMTLTDTALSPQDVSEVIETYRRFFKSSDADKHAVDMARTGANRGWGAAGSERVNPDANPDYKQFFDCGWSPEPGAAHADKAVYAPNIWPEDPEFRRIVERYFDQAMAISENLLHAIAKAVEMDPSYFKGAFDAPMALLRGNYYPSRPAGAGEKDFGIATHTDYGCLTLLATDGSPGLEVRKRGGGWIPLSAPPGEFIINFGEMLEFWTGGRVKATPHRVVGGSNERISVPLFFNPAFDTNVAPPGSTQPVLAGDHLSRRYNETYLHLQRG